MNTIRRPSSCRLRPAVLLRFSAVSLIAAASWLNIGASMGLFPSLVLFGMAPDDAYDDARIARVDAWARKGGGANRTETTTRVVGLGLGRSTSTGPPTGGACDGYKGVLHIQCGDKGAAAGTLFFQYVTNQLIYADMHDLIPWIHLNDVSSSVYDAEEHGRGGPSVTYTVRRGAVEMISDPHAARGYAYPGPINITRVRNSTDTLTISGNGVWGSYFEPVSPFFSMDDPSCVSKVFIALEYEQLTPGMHFNAPWAVRSWPYRHSPMYLRDYDMTLKDWYRPMRFRAAAIVRKYYRPRRWLVEAARAANPISSSAATATADDGDEEAVCLAMHVRWSDKGGLARRRINLDEYLPYVQAFVDIGGSVVYLATDSKDVQRTVEQDWPRKISKRIRSQRGVVQTRGRRAVFNAGVAHHRTNTEILTEIYAMSECRLFLHGFSAVSEATIYVNPSLIDDTTNNCSVDLEDPNHVSVDEFRDAARAVLGNRSL